MVHFRTRITPRKSAKNRLGNISTELIIPVEKKVVLVERDTEEFVLPIICGGYGYNLDAEGISVIGAWSKSGLDRLYRIFNQFQISTYIIIDSDRE